MESTLYRNIWSKLTPGTGNDQQYAKYESQKGKTKGTKNQRRSTMDQQENLEAIRKHIKKRLNRKTRKTYIRNPVSSIRSLSARKSAGKSSAKRPTRPWYSDGFPEFHAANETHKRKQRPARGQLASAGSVATSRGRQRRNRKSIYFDDDSDEVPYYRSKSVKSSSRRNSTFTPVTNEQDVVYKTYTGRDVKTPLRPSSLPGILTRRRSTPVQKTISHTLPHQRRSYSVDKLQADVFRDVNKLYAETTSDLKKQYDSNLAKLPRQHYNIRFMKVEKSEKARLGEAFRNIARLKQLTSKLENDIKHQYFENRTSSDEIGDKFERVKKTKTSETPIYLQNRSFTKLKLDPITRPTDSEIRRQSDTKRKRTQLPDITRKSNNGGQQRDQESESGYDTGYAADSSTMETMSTVVVMATPTPSPDRKNVKGKQGKTNMRPSKRRESKQSTLIKNKKKEMVKAGIETANEMPVFTDTHVGIDIREQKHSDPEVENPSSRTPNMNNTDTQIQRTGSASRSTARNDASLNSYQKQTTVARFSTEAGDVRIPTVDDVDIEQQRRMSAERNDIPYMDKDNIIKDSMSAKNHKAEIQDNRKIRSPDNNTERYSTHSVTVKTTYTNKIKPNQASPDRDNRDNESTKGPMNDKTDSVADQFYDEDTRSSSVINKRKISKHVTSYDVVVNRNEYERKGHEVAQDEIRRNSLLDTTQTKNIHNEVTGGLVTNNTVSKTESITENERTVERIAQQPVTDLNPITWKEIAERHKVQQNTSVVTNVETTVNETEYAMASEAGTGGTHQWRDLVQKYLTQPNPKVGKSADRHLLEMHEDEDDDDDMDIFERAKQKYMLDVDSDDSREG